MKLMQFDYESKEPMKEMLASNFFLSQNHRKSQSRNRYEQMMTSGSHKRIGSFSFVEV